MSHVRQKGKTYDSPCKGILNRDLLWSGRFIFYKIIEEEKECLILKE